MKLFEGQVEQLSKRLALLETENTSLGDRNRMLERLAQIVDEAPAVRVSPCPFLARESWYGPGMVCAALHG